MVLPHSWNKTPLLSKWTVSFDKIFIQYFVNYYSAYSKMKWVTQAKAYLRFIGKKGSPSFDTETYQKPNTLANKILQTLAWNFDSN